MKKFIESKKYSAETGTEIIVDRRTAKYLVIGMPTGEMKWAYIRETEETEYFVINGEKVIAKNLVEEEKINTPKKTVECGVQWREFGKDDRVVNKEKFFGTEKAMMNFIKKLEEKSNFYEIVAYTGQ